MVGPIRRLAHLGLLGMCGLVALAGGSLWLSAAAGAAASTTWLLERCRISLRVLAPLALLWSAVLGSAAGAVWPEGGLGLLLGGCAVLFWLGWFVCGRAVEGSPRWERLRAACFGAAPFAALALAALLLDGNFVDWPRRETLPAALAVLGLGFAAGAGGFSSRHLRVREKGAKGRRAWFAGPLLLTMLAAISAWLLMQGPLHAASDKLIRWASSWSGILPAPPVKPPDAGPDEESEAAEGGDGEREEPGSEWDRAELPVRIDLELDHEPRVLLDFHEEEVERQWRNRVIHLRRFALERFSGASWERSDTAETLRWDGDDGTQDGVAWLGPRRDGEVRYAIGTETEAGQPLLVMPGELAFELDRIYVRRPAWYSVEQEGRLRYGAISAPRRLEDLPAASVHPESEAPGGTLDLPEEPWAARLREAAEEINRESGSTGEALEGIRRYLWENIAFSPRIENPSDLHPMENFLFEERRGYCDFYATAGALMARALGVPSRIAFGYGGGEYDEAQGVFVFFSDDGHAWAEILLAGEGWVIFDTTPPGSGAASPPASLTGENEEKWSGFEDLREIQSRVDAEVEQESLWERLRGWIAAVPLEAWLAALAVGLGLVWLLRALRRKRGQAARSGESELESAPKYLQAFYRLCGDWGFRRSRAQTLKEFLWGLKQEKLIGDEFDGMAEYYYGVSYEWADSDSGQERHWLERAQRARRKSRRNEES
ncbi:MAG TPA: transglutaminase-like domain-containing protein [Verrucomicrobiales bacterium]|nr:transglutaminase-like domain-containing protein [Verrucomicrobiales bacterium]